MKLKEIPILKEAIKMEIDTQKIYTKLMNKAKTQNGKYLFEALTVEEQKHEVLIKDFLKTGNIETSRSMLQVYKSKFTIKDKIIDPSYDQKELCNGMLLAVKNERIAAQKYLAAYNECYLKEKSIKLKNLLSILAKEELRHENILKTEFKLLFGYWDDESPLLK